MLKISAIKFVTLKLSQGTLGITSRFQNNNTNYSNLMIGEVHVSNYKLALAKNTILKLLTMIVNFGLT